MENLEEMWKEGEAIVLSSYWIFTYFWEASSLPPAQLAQS